MNFTNGSVFNNCPPVRPGLFQEFDHFLYRDPVWIVNDGVDLPERLPADIYEVNPWLPFQGSFSYVVSGDVKLDGGRLGCHDGGGDGKD